jgi:WD40 repeat protein
VTLSGHNRAVASAQFSADGKRVVTASHDKTARVWDAQTGALLATLPTDASEAQTIAISRDGTHVVVACYDGAARIWDIGAYQPR